MLKSFTIFACCLLFTAHIHAQSDCGNGRYLEEIFNDFSLTSDITYGQNFDFLGNSQSLELDVYEPTGDVEPLRPLIVLQHGGSFIFGDKTAPDMTSLAEPLAKMGYVVASIEYRLGIEGIPFPGADSATASEAVWRGVADLKAAVRWFYKDAANGNAYRIDTTRLFIGGVSAGAVSAMHYAYLDDINEMPAYLDTTKLGLGGGIEGASGNAGYSSEIAGVVSVSGMLADTAWIKPGDEPAVMLHGTNDDVVPYSTDLITVVSLYPIFVVDGSESINKKMDQIGIDNCLYTHYGAGHTPHVGDAAYTDTTLNIITNFLINIVCGGGPPSCGYVVATEAALSEGDFTVYPNPASSEMRIIVPEEWRIAWQYRLLDMTGRTLQQGSVMDQTEIELSRNFPAGVYLLEMRSGDTQKTVRVAFE